MTEKGVTTPSTIKHGQKISCSICIHNLMVPHKSSILQAFQECPFSEGQMLASRHCFTRGIWAKNSKSRTSPNIQWAWWFQEIQMSKA